MPGKCEGASGSVPGCNLSTFVSFLRATHDDRSDEHAQRSWLERILGGPAVVSLCCGSLDPFSLLPLTICFHVAITTPPSYFIEVQLLEDPVGAWTAAAPFLIVFLTISGAVTWYLLNAIEKEQAEQARIKKER